MWGPFQWMFPPKCQTNPGTGSCQKWASHPSHPTPPAISPKDCWNMLDSSKLWYYQRIINPRTNKLWYVLNVQIQVFEGDVQNHQNGHLPTKNSIQTPVETWLFILHNCFPYINSQFRGFCLRAKSTGNHHICWEKRRELMQMLHRVHTLTVGFTQLPKTTPQS